MLQLDHIQVSYAGQMVLDGLSCEVRSGDIVSLLGRSGSGKTTVLQSIADEYEYDRPVGAQIRQWHAVPSFYHSHYDPAG